MTKKIIFVFFTILIMMVLSSLTCNDDDINNKWIDPCTQTTQLIDGIELLDYTGGTDGNFGNVYLPDSPYGYETFDYRDYPEHPLNYGINTNRFIWYGANQGGGGAFRAEWTSYFLARLGFYWGKNAGRYTQYKNIYVDYNYTRSNNASSPHGGWIGVYGWSFNPSASIFNERRFEYYIVDDWIRYNTPEIEGTELGFFQVDGAIYKLYKVPHYDATQLFSVRQTRRTYGTISVTEHFKAWNQYIDMGIINEAKFLIEAFNGNGYLDLTYLYLSMEDRPRPPEKICIGGDDTLTIKNDVITDLTSFDVIAGTSITQRTVFQGRNNVLELSPVSDNYEWALIVLDLTSFAGKTITIEFSVDVWLNNPAKILWQVNLDLTYPIIAVSPSDVSSGSWHKISGTNRITVPAGGAVLYLSGGDSIVDTSVYLNDVFVKITE